MGAMCKKALIMMACSLTSGLVGGQDLQQISQSLSISELPAGATKLTLPRINGVDIRLLGADYQEIIDSKGKISRVLSETPVQVSFKLTKGKESAISPDYQVLVKPSTQSDSGNAKPKVVPELLEWKGGQGEYRLGGTLFCSQGLTGLASRFLTEIQEVSGQKLTQAQESKDASLALILNKQVEKESQPPYGKEGYRMHITPERVTIEASTYEGIQWGTRSLLQILRQTGGTIPCGTAVDFPRFALRGFMLDVARTPVPLSYIRDVIRQMSWYKMNDLHLHLNDNYIFHEEYVDAGKDPAKESYSAFRLESDMVGKNGQKLTAQDLFFSKAEFAQLVQFAKSYGINIVPEFDTPGHALAFTRVRPDLVYQGPMPHHPKRRCEMLDAANPETLRFVTSVFNEYLKPQKGKPAVFKDCRVIHVGADEFFGAAEDYRKYADGLLKHVLKSGHTPRIWGSLNTKKGTTPVQAKGVQMNLWNDGWAKAWDSINQGYDIINTNDGALYIVPFAPYYRMDTNHKGIYNNWLPNRIGNETVPSGHPQLLGATFAIWQDMTDLKHNGYAPYDLWKTICGSMDVLSQKMWGTPRLPSTFEEHRHLVKSVGEAPLTQVLSRWKDMGSFELKPSKLPVELGKNSLGPDYHVTMEITMNNRIEGQEQVLLDGPSGQLLAADQKGNIAFRRDDTLEFSFGYALPLGQKVKLELIGYPGRTELFIDGRPVGQLSLTTFHGNKENLQSTFILPLKTLGRSFCGSIDLLRVEPSAPARP